MGTIIPITDFLATPKNPLFPLQFIESNQERRGDKYRRVSAGDEANDKKKGEIGGRGRTEKVEG